MRGWKRGYRGARAPWVNSWEIAIQDLSFADRLESMTNSPPNYTLHCLLSSTVNPPALISLEFRIRLCALLQLIRKYAEFGLFFGDKGDSQG